MVARTGWSDIRRRSSLEVGQCRGDLLRTQFILSYIGNRDLLSTQYSVFISPSERRIEAKVKVTIVTNYYIVLPIFLIAYQSLILNE